MLTSSDFLKIEEDRDIIRYDGRIYSNATALEWFEKEKRKFQKGKKLGVIKKHKNATLLFCGNLTAINYLKEQNCIIQIIGKAE